MSAIANQVKEFQIKFPTPLRYKDDRLKLYQKLIGEEYQELLESDRSVLVLDALADITYLCYGLAYLLELPLDAALSEVHKSNMSKGPDIRHDGKILKGHDYKPHDLWPLIDSYRSKP
jgi:Phosphoribosyl-ATP pyrophosphohydrolase